MINEERQRETEREREREREKRKRGEGRGGELGKVLCVRRQMIFLKIV